MITYGTNMIDGLVVSVESKRTRHLRVHIDCALTVHLTVPYHRASLLTAENFLRENWAWVLRARARLAAQPPPPTREPLSAEEEKIFRETLNEFCRVWSERLDETDYSVRLKTMKSRWGSCHWKKRVLTFNTELARVHRDLINYVVAHEFMHFQAHDHGEKFQSLMSAHLPNWKMLRRQLPRQ